MTEKIKIEQRYIQDPIEASYIRDLVLKEGRCEVTLAEAQQIYNKISFELAGVSACYLKEFSEREILEAINDSVQFIY